LEAGSKKKTPKRAVIAVAIVILAAIALFIWILFSATSPLASIHDADGDGHPDANDAAPNNPLLWAKGSATIEVKISTMNTRLSHYTLSLDGVEKAQGDIAAWSSVTHSITVDFLYGVRNYATVTVQVTGTIQVFKIIEGVYVDTPISRQSSVNVATGQTYPVQFFIYF
jgi:HAMP domain-containing protein